MAVVTNFARSAYSALYAYITWAQFRSSQNHWWNTCSSHASICFQCHEGLRVAEDEGDVVKPEAIIWPSTQVWCCNNPRCTITNMKLTELAWDQLLLCTSGYLWLNRMQHCMQYCIHTYIIHRHRLYKHTVTALLQNMWLRLHRGTIAASQRIAPSDDTLESREIIHRPESRVSASIFMQSDRNYSARARAHVSLVKIKWTETVLCRNYSTTPNSWKAGACQCEPPLEQSHLHPSSVQQRLYEWRKYPQRILCCESVQACPSNKNCILDHCLSVLL